MDLDAAVSKTLELETYATPKPNVLPVLGVNEEDNSGNEASAVGPVTPSSSNNLADLIKGLSERLDRLEVSEGNRGQGKSPTIETRPAGGQGTLQPYGRGQYSRREDVVC